MSSKYPTAPRARWCAAIHSLLPALLFVLALALPRAAAAQPVKGEVTAVAEVPDGGPDENALVGHAVKTMTEGNVIKVDIPHRIRTFYGRQLGLVDASGGYSYVAVFLRNKRLYQIEGKAFAAGGQAEIDAMIFQQSLDFT